MYSYQIIKAKAIVRYDLKVNGCIVSCSTKKHDVQAEANQMVRQGYLVHSEQQLTVIKRGMLYV
jgi:hypothetical protein